MSGLGIDFGSPASSISSGSRKQPLNHGQQKRPRSMQLTESLNQFNDINRRSIPSKPGNPRPMSAIDPKSAVHDGKSYSSGPMNRNSRLGAAVAAMGDRDWDSTSNATPSDMYSPTSSSPRTETSATSYAPSAAGSNGLKRTQTVRKQVSQPNLSRSSTMVKRNTTDAPSQQQRSSRGPPSPDDHARGMIRSKSSMSLASQYRTNQPTQASLSRSITSGSTSLGRTSEIPRSASRAAAVRGRGGSMRGGMASNRRTTLDVQQSQQEPNAGDIMMIDGKRMIADGFGGYVEVKESEPDAESPRGTKYESKPTSLESQQAQNRPSLAPAQIPKPRPRSYTMGQLPNPAALRVGSFYGPDGEERARIDEDGRLSQHDYHRNSISESSDGPAPSSHHSSNASGRSAGPRLQFMNSPGVSAQSTREGTSVASGKSNAHSSTASGDGKGQLHKSVSMRSAHGFRGLSAAERGEAMVSLDDLNRYASTGYEEGEYILPGRTRTMDDESILQSVRLDARRESAEDLDQQRPRGHMRQASAPAGLHKLDDETTVRRQNATQLDRHGTLISSASNPARRSKDLTRLLGNNSGKLSSSASSDAGSSLSSASALSKSSNASNSMSTIMPQAVLEQGKSGKSRVDVDLILESELVVEGGMLTGRLEVKVRKNSTKDGHLMLSQPKVRVVGFEELVNDDTRHIFYHYATVIDGCTKVGKNVSQPYVLHGSPNLSPEADNRQPLACFASQPDSEGYSVAKEGQHSIPFALELPVGKGAKGTYRGKHAVVRYIVIGSVKLKSENGSNRSIAHFYRHIDLYPYLNPAIVLAGSGKPVQARASKGLFLGGSGKVHLIASLHRSSWVAGQRLYVNLRIDNETSKRVKSLTMTLIRTVILYRPRPEFDMALSAPDDPSETYIDPDACTTSTSRKKICEDVLEMGQKGAKGTVTARGWWTGVEAGAAVELSHNMKLPVDALTITRGRHVEVSYSLKISVGSSLSSDVSVELPVRIVNFVSLDPPPLKSSIKHVTPARMNGRNAVSDSEAPMIARVRSMEALKSPQRIGNEFAGANDGRYLNVHRHVDAMQMTNNRGNQQRNLLPEDPEAARAKKLQHQKSLDFINHAIRSATARRVGSVSSNEPSPAGLGIEVDEARTPLAEESSGASSISDDSSSYVSSSAASMSSASEAIHPSCKPYQHMNNNYPPIVSLSGVVGGPRPIYMPSHSISVDDADDDSDEEYNAGEQTLILNDDSVADIDMVIGSAQVDGGESSPEFSQNRGMEAFGGDLTIGGENEGDLSTSTITSNDDNLYNEQMEDEFDEEEERLTALRQRQNQDQDDGPTPLARSPPKFQSNIPVRPPLSRNVDSSMSSPSDGNMSDTLSGYASTASSTAMSTNSAKELAEAKREGKTVVRTRSDLEKRLGRSSTIIRGPSTASSRPVSPSKQNPIPAKSALKTKSSFTYATAEQPIKQQASRTAPLTMPAASVRAKVDPHKALTAHKNPRPSVPMKQQQQKRIQLASDSEMSSASSESSNSPATSASALTPREQMSELEDGLPFDADRTIHASDLGGLGLQLQPIVQSVGIEDGMPKSKSVSMAVRPTQPKKASVTSIPTSVSARSANQASGVVAPSVRDKIAMLESRKRALKEFTAGGGGLEVPNNESVGTPPASRNARSNATPKQDPDTPTRVQAAAKSFLERNNSVLSQTSSVATSVQPDYLRNMSSVQSFKAPLLREK